MGDQDQGARFLASDEPGKVVGVIDAPVKLVIWDLDDTFWRGTLSEEAVTPVEAHIELVKTLARRGIISSVASKNDPDTALAELRRQGVEDFLVLPRIGFRPKGSVIVELIKALQLRPADVVFIDDNPTVLAEAAYACPGLTCLGSPSQLEAQMGGAYLRGRPDPELERLTQYRELAERNDLRAASGLSNESFLRQSEIRVDIDYDVEPHIDRIVELINRSNQLNYTKRRIETGEARRDLLQSLRKYGFNAGVVRVSDKHADYGIVGFFMTLATLQGYHVEHLVFSCRIMNMGVEQYVYDYLRRPAIEIAEPVANPLVSYEAVDWISPGSHARTVTGLSQARLVLIGGCDMLQLSTYCSMNSVEFTNRVEHGLMKRLDDPFLILDDPERVAASPLRSMIPAFNAEDMLLLRTAAGAADAFVLSLYRMMEFNYFRGRDGLMVRLDEDAVKAILASEQGLWFVRHFTFVELTNDERSELVARALGGLAAMARPDAKIIVLLENVRRMDHNPEELNLRRIYNQFIVARCEASANMAALDVNAATDAAWLFDDGFHMHRQGYFELAEAVRAVIDGG